MCCSLLSTLRIHSLLPSHLNHHKNIPLTAPHPRPHTHPRRRHVDSLPIAAWWMVTLVHGVRGMCRPCWCTAACVSNNYRRRESTSTSCGCGRSGPTNGTTSGAPADRSRSRRMAVTPRRSGSRCPNMPSPRRPCAAHGRSTPRREKLQTGQTGRMLLISPSCSTTSPPQKFQELVVLCAAHPARGAPMADQRGPPRTRSTAMVDHPQKLKPPLPRRPSRAGQRLDRLSQKFQELRALCAACRVWRLGPAPAPHARRIMSWSTHPARGAPMVDHPQQLHIGENVAHEPAARTTSPKRLEHLNLLQRRKSSQIRSSRARP